MLAQFLAYWDYKNIEHNAGMYVVGPFSELCSAGHMHSLLGPVLLSNYCTMVTREIYVEVLLSSESIRGGGSLIVTAQLFGALLNPSLGKVADSC